MVVSQQSFFLKSGFFIAADRTTIGRKYMQIYLVEIDVIKAVLYECPHSITAITLRGIVIYLTDTDKKLCVPVDPVEISQSDSADLSVRICAVDHKKLSVRICQQICEPFFMFHLRNGISCTGQIAQLFLVDPFVEQRKILSRDTFQMYLFATDHLPAPHFLYS